MSENGTKHGIFLVRATLGFCFVMHGMQKCFGLWGGLSYGRFRTLLEHHGVPLANVAAYVVPWLELLAGIALLVGFAHQMAASVTAFLMAGAIIYFHWRHGYFLDHASAHEHGIEYALALLAMSLLVIFAGPGSFAYKIDLKQHKPH